MAEKTKKKHTVRNVILIILAVLIVGGGISGLVSALGGSNNLAGEWKVIGLQTGFQGLNDTNENYDFIDENTSKALFANFDKKESALTIYNKDEDSQIDKIYFKLPYYGYTNSSIPEIKTSKFTFGGVKTPWYVQRSYEKGDEYVYIQYSCIHSREYYGDKEHLQTEINDYKGDFITRFSLVKEDYSYTNNVKLDEIKAGTSYVNKIKSDSHPNGSGNLTIKEITKTEQDGNTVYKGVLNFGNFDEEFSMSLQSDGRYSILTNYKNNSNDCVNRYTILQADANKFVVRPDTKTVYDGINVRSITNLYSYIYTYAK